MARCSKKYMDKVVTRSGFTPEKPWSTTLGVNLPSVFEYEEWQIRAKELVEEMWRHYVVLGDTEGRLGSFPAWNRLREEVNDVWARYEELPTGVLASFDVTKISFKEDVEDSIKVAVDAVCTMEKIDAAIEDYGQTAPGIEVTPTRTPREPDREGIGVLGMLGVLALAGAGVYGVVRYTRKDDKVE